MGKQSLIPQGLGWSGTLSVHLQGSGRARPQWDLEKGAVVNMEMSCTGGQGGKRHKDDDPKPCKQNSLCGTAKQRGSQHVALVPSFSEGILGCHYLLPPGL